MTTSSKSSTQLVDKALFSTHYSIYINHTDAGGIVYHANHLVFFENCRRDWFTELGLSGYFMQTAEGHIQHFVVSQAQLQYRKAILLDEVITVRIDKVELKPASILFYQSIHRQTPTAHEHSQASSNPSSTDTLLSSAKIVIACVQNQQSPNPTESLAADTLADNPLAGQSEPNAASIKPVRVPKHLHDTIKQAIDRHHASG